MQQCSFPAQSPNMLLSKLHKHSSISLAAMVWVNSNQAQCNTRFIEDIYAHRSNALLISLQQKSVMSWEGIFWAMRIVGDIRMITLEQFFPAQGMHVFPILLSLNLI